MRLSARVARLLVRGPGERYSLGHAALDRVAAMVERAARDADAVEEIGSLLKLIHVLRTRFGSPTTAKALIAILRSSPAAKRIVSRHWSGSYRPNRAADLTPIRTARAPLVTATAPNGSIKVHTLLSPGQDLRGRRLAAGRR